MTWNNQNFNQGSPKPDGSYPGSTDADRDVRRLDRRVHAQWTSQVVGGPFDKFTGQWHLAGRFVPAAGSSTTKSIERHTSRTHVSDIDHQRSTTTGGRTGRRARPRDDDGRAARRPARAASQCRQGSQQPPSGAGHWHLQVAPVVAREPAAASTNTVSRESWHATWWLLAIAIAIAVVGFGGCSA